jgi:hypothetical protein
MLNVVGNHDPTYRIIKRNSICMLHRKTDKSNGCCLIVTYSKNAGYSEPAVSNGRAVVHRISYARDNSCP